MVLFLLGLVGFLMLNARQIGVYVKENIGFNIELKNDLRDADMQQLKKMIDAKTFVRSSEYISKEEAAVETQKALGEDFLEEIDLSLLSQKHEVIVEPPSKRQIHHTYSDRSESPSLINCYSIDEILAEKTRAIFERKGRARDIYDVVNLGRNFKEEINAKKAFAVLVQTS